MLELDNVCKHYISKNKQGRKTILQAVNGVFMVFQENRTYALVGESGSGKSTLARLITCIEKPTKGQITMDGQMLSSMNRKQLRKKRADFQMVMQDGFSSLDPRMTIYNSIAEPIRNFEHMTKKEEQKRVEALMEKVELPLSMLKRLPHQLSGGQQKRVCIARAISINPRFIVFDEAVSGLDVTVRKKILDLLLALRKDMGSTYLFITHDLDVAVYMSRDIMVMKDGVIVEQIHQLKSFKDFQHDYSRMLIKALPPRVPQRMR